MNKDGRTPSYPSKELSNEALEQIVRLNSGDTQKSERIAFKAWRARSAEHEAAAVEAEQLWYDASDLHLDPETGLVRPGRKRSGVSRRSVIRGIAGVGLGAAGLVWANSALRPLLADHSTGVAEIQALNFPDGTRVLLNAMSALNVAYSPVRRRMTMLEGQAYFEVAKDAARPFEVEARGATVSALGTAFDIDSNLAGGRVGVFVSQHSVRVQTAHSLASIGTVLSEGHKVVVTATGEIGQVVEEDAAAALAWRTGMLIVENRPLEDVIAALRAYHKGWIVIPDDSVKALKVNAVLDLRTPDESLDALAAGLPIRVRHLSNFMSVISGA